MQSVALRVSLLGSLVLLGSLIVAPQTGAAATTGGVIAWGTTFADVNVVPPQAQSGVSAVAASSHALALKDGGVIAWGYNADGQATVPDSARSGVTAIAAGNDHSMAIKNGGVIAWGDNTGGQTTVPEGATSGVTAIAAGAVHSLALKDGGVIAWGYDGEGQTSVPAEAKSGVTAIAAGPYHSLAIKDGRVIAWGYNSDGQSTVPGEALSGVTAIAAGLYHSLAIKNGRVIAWGANSDGETSVPAEALTGATSVAAGAFHSLALVNGGVVAWGANVEGQTNVPAQARLGVTAIAAGGGLSLAVGAGEPNPVPEVPAGLTASVGEWQESGLPVTFTWSPPRAGSPAVDTYLLTTPTSATGQTTESLAGDTTRWRVTLPRAVTTGTYAVTLVARNPAGESAPARVSVAVPPKTRPVPEPVRDLRIAQDQAGGSLRLTWGRPAVPADLTLNYYQVERRVPSEYRAGTEWRLMATPTTQAFVDRCVPPGLTLDYRVRAYYVEKDTQRVYQSDWRETAGRNPGFPGPAPDPSPAELLFNGISPEEGPRSSQRAHLKVAFNGDRQDQGDCFALEHEIGYSLRGTGSSPLSPYSPLAVTPGRSDTSDRGLIQNVYSLGPTSFDKYVNVRVQARWALDSSWQRRYGAGFNDNILALGATVSRGSASKQVDSPWRIYTSNAGVRVGNLQVAWRDDAGLRITWDAPPETNPNAINGRGYEVCIYSVENYVYLNDYPTLSHHKCWITARDQRVLTPSLADWCPPQSRAAVLGCGRSARYMFAQVRPWVGAVKAQSVFPTSIWTDWNRDTFSYARPAL